ncbi:MULTISPECIES: hypothetical protein [Cellulophaga]|uniref:Uncharacterized protein n=1 Tax=Cellulophaga algicola (strain DSM 14237 / IC166 / ACAM 630) TaxID=688270 RepID=E6XCP7_CELAD|nr:MULTISPECIES: hypothetical protein [Cellulophaga]ADV49036.1 hypothetical protein Celal_1735 [Cellulophaga algicola DSM 14237]
MQKSFILFVVLIIVITIAALIERQIDYDSEDDYTAFNSSQLKTI